MGSRAWRPNNVADFRSPW